MKDIPELLKLIEKSMSAKDEDVINFFVNKDIESSKVPEVSRILYKIKREMEKPRADKTPLQIWIEETGNKSSFPYFQGMAEYYSMYYYSILDMVFKSKLPSRLHNEINKILRFDWSLDSKSSFHRHSSELDRILKTRNERILKVQELSTWK